MNRKHSLIERCMKYIFIIFGGFFGITIKGAAVYATHKHLLAYGFKGITKQYGTIQCKIELEYCWITVWIYKNDVGSAIQPKSCGPREYKSKLVEEVPLGRKALHKEVSRQVKHIVDKYPNVLWGEFGDWPLG